MYLVINVTKFLNQARIHRRAPGFLKLILWDLGMRACARVCVRARGY